MNTLRVVTHKRWSRVHAPVGKLLFGLAWMFAKITKYFSQPADRQKIWKTSKFWRKHHLVIYNILEILFYLSGDPCIPCAVRSNKISKSWDGYIVASCRISELGDTKRRLNGGWIQHLRTSDKSATHGQSTSKYYGKVLGTRIWQHTLWTNMDKPFLCFNHVSTTNNHIAGPEKKPEPSWAPGRHESTGHAAKFCRTVDVSWRSLLRDACWCCWCLMPSLMFHDY